MAFAAVQAAQRYVRLLLAALVVFAAVQAAQRKVHGAGNVL